MKYIVVIRCIICFATVLARNIQNILSLHLYITNNFIFVPETKKQKSVMADIDCSTKTNVTKKRNIITSKQMNSLIGKSKDHDPGSLHPDRIQQ